MTHLAGDPMRCSVRVSLLAFTIRPNPGKSIHPKPLHWISEGKKMSPAVGFPVRRYDTWRAVGTGTLEAGSDAWDQTNLYYSSFFFRVYFVFVYIHSPTLLLFASISKGKYFLTHESINGGMDENNHSLGFLNDSITRTAISSSSSFFFNAGIERSKKNFLRYSFSSMFFVLFTFIVLMLSFTVPLI